MLTAKPQIPNEVLAEIEALKDCPIDLSDAPEIQDWSGAKRGMFRFNQAKVTLDTNELFEQDFITWLSMQPVATKQKIQELVRVALNLSHVNE